MKFDVLIKGEPGITFNNGKIDGYLYGTINLMKLELDFLEKTNRPIGGMNYEPTKPYIKDPIAVRIYLTEKYGSEVTFVGDEQTTREDINENPNRPPVWAE